MICNESSFIKAPLMSHDQIKAFLAVGKNLGIRYIVFTIYLIILQEGKTCQVVFPPLLHLASQRVFCKDLGIHLFCLKGNQRKGKMA